MGMEIERKFCIDGFPDLPILEEAEMEQGYISCDPTVRIRSKRTQTGVSYRLCFKGEGTLARQEIELPLEETVFHQLQWLLTAPMIRKTYKVFALPDGHRLEVSRVDEGLPSSFWYAEVEFESVEEATAFVPPACLGEDVTENPAFGMSYYWRHRGDGAPQA